MRRTSFPNPSFLPRPPIVVVVGHVDHGKTSLLDYIRNTNIAAKEAGAITQSIGAYEIWHNGKRITFIDTPGHEAFFRMRERGAKAADIAVLVVAADEGVKPQTLEAIKILRNLQTPFIVAITKIDKQNANVEKVKNELLANGVLLEGLGGDVSWQAVSSKSGEGINELLDLILLLGEVLELKFNPASPATGFVIESLKESRRGIVAHLVLVDGILKVGDPINTPTASGRVKVLENFLGKKVKELTPASPAAVFGFETLPAAGEIFLVGEKPATEVPLPVRKLTVDENSKDNKICAILKADTSGSLEVLKQIVDSLVRVTDMSVGDVTDGDVKLAVSSQSIIIGFKVKVNKAAQVVAKAQGVKVFTSEVIYKLVEMIENYLKEAANSELLGELEVLKVFGADGKQQIIGGQVLTGVISKGFTFTIQRGKNNLGIGRIINLQENRKDVSEVRESSECGLLVDSEIEIKIGDRIKVFK